MHAWGTEPKGIWNLEAEKRFYEVIVIPSLLDCKSRLRKLAGILVTFLL